MSNRITLISLLDGKEITKIEKLMSVVKENTCKVPYGIDDQNREAIDNLPYHFTIFATNKKNQERLLNLLQNIKFDKICLSVNDIKIMNGKNESYCLYLSVEENQYIRDLQRIFYKELSEEYYNPDNFVFHMTLHIDKDYKKIVKMQQILKQSFKSFCLEFSTLALFDYPGEMIDKFDL